MSETAGTESTPRKAGPSGAADGEADGEGESVSSAAEDGAGVGTAAGGAACCAMVCSACTSSAAAASPAEEAHADSNISHIKLSEQGLILFGSFYFPLLLLFCIAARLISNQIKRKVVAK